MKRLPLVPALAATALVVCPVLAWSQSPPTTQQQRPHGEADGRPRSRPSGERHFGNRRAPAGFGGTVRGGGGAGEWRRGDHQPDFAPPNAHHEPTEQEWTDIAAFMKTHSPKRLERLEEIGDDKRQQNVRNMFAARYRAMEELKERNPELYQIRLNRMPIEDEVFALSWETAHSPNPTTSGERQKLRPLLRQLITSRLQERMLRLKQTEQRLALARQQLQEDEQRIEALVEENLADIADERLPRALRPQLTPPRPDPRNGDEGASPDDAVSTPAAE